MHYFHEVSKEGLIIPLLDKGTVLSQGEDILNFTQRVNGEVDVNTFLLDRGSGLSPFSPPQSLQGRGCKYLNDVEGEKASGVGGMDTG